MVEALPAAKRCEIQSNDSAAALESAWNRCGRKPFNANPCKDDDSYSADLSSASPEEIADLCIELLLE